MPDPNGASTATTETPQAEASPRSDRLELIQQLSAGSLGVVYKARNPKLERVVALRQIQVPDWIEDLDELLKRMLGEARAANGLEHPNIARLYTGGYKGCTVFLTAEFIDGLGVKEFAAKNNAGLAQIMALAKQLCSALDYAHQKNVYHPALTAANIKVLPDGTLKVLDFGVSREKHVYSPAPAKRLENEHYLSPEQVKQKPVDRAANLFSAATIIYELFTTRHPFAGKHLGEVDRNITDLEPPLASQSHPRVPEAVSNVLKKALSKNPAARYQSGQELMSALTDAMSGVPAKAAAAAASATGTRPAVSTGPNPAPQTGSFARPAPASAVPAPVQQGRPAAQPAATTQTRPAATTVRRPAVPAPIAPAKMSARSVSQWLWGAAIVAVLFVVSAVAISLRHRSDTPVPAGSAETVPQPKTNTPAATVTDSPSVQVREVQRRSGHEKIARLATSAPVPAPVPDGQLGISSSPTGATVEIAGRPGESGKTPLTVPSLAPGTYKVTISKNGYATETRNVEVQGGNRAVLDVKLNPTKGYLNIAGTPAGAQIVIDGRETGKTSPADFTLDPATHTVTLRKEGFLETSSEIKLAAGQSVSYSPSMKLAGRTDNIQVMGGFKKLFGGKSAQGMARMEIKTDPKGAQVVINGTTLPKGTPLEIQVEPGNYDITLEKDGYRPVHTSVLAQANDKLKIEETMQK